MASRFVNLEAQVATSSDEEQFDDDDLFSADNEEDTSTDDRHENPPMGSFPELESHRQTSARFLEELEERYTRGEPENESSSTPQTAQSVLGKRKAPEAGDPFEQCIVSLLAKHPAPEPAPCSLQPRPRQAINRVTRMPLPRREQPITIPPQNRLLHSYSASTDLFGDPWINGTPKSAIPQKGNLATPSKSLAKHKELRKWISWAKKEGKRCEYAPGEWVTVQRGTYKGDVGMVWKMKTREKTEAEIDAERKEVAESVSKGEPVPDTSPELVDEGYWVFLIPRLPPPDLTKDCSLRLKQKRPKGAPRFPPRRFIPEEYDVRLLHRNDTRVQGYNIDGYMISRGLLMKVYRVDALDVCPLVTSDTLLAFGLAFGEHPFCRRFPLPVTDLWCFVPGDEVEVEVSHSPASPQSGRGIVSSVGEGSTLVDFGDPGIHPAPIRLLTKVILVGDYVKTLRGANMSKEGSVVERHGNILGISQRGTRTGIDYFAHVNSVVKLKHAPLENSSVPWLGTAVQIFRGPHCERTGIIQDVRRKPNRPVLFLWLFLPELQQTAEVEDRNVFVKGSRILLWDMYPLSPDQRYYHIDRVGETSSGPVPWIGTYVGIIKGPHKGKEGTVKDVNRTTKPKALSGLMVTVELNVYGVARLDEQIYYDYVRERGTGTTLATHQPLLNQQSFYTPNEAFVPWGVVFDKRPSFFLLLDDKPEIESLAREDDISTVNDPNDLPMDVWNPHWSYPSSEDASPSSPNTTVSPPTLSAPDAAASNALVPPSHWLSQAELLGLTILVDITEGPHSKVGQYVEVAATSDGTTVARVRKGKGKRLFEVPLSSVAKSSKRPNAIKEENLLVVATGEQQHRGKLVRRIHHFYEGSVMPENRWLILAVVDREDPVQKLTGEVIECKIHDLEFVEEASTDRFRATHVFMRRVRDEARIKLSADVRDPGTVNLDDLRACITSHMTSYHGSSV
ncbi:hypothetical protein V5O48_013409 [Marasmius crinis-equi]|uniref:KOW domain-containing protein n=1 Tax=Marasmius crinis-equi TaxID=585013 RepID=A0ABR3F051_9AGAR